MTQRQVRSASHGIHLDSLVCEKYMNKLVNREKQINHLLSTAARGRDKLKPSLHDHRDMKPRPNVRQQNVISPPSKSPGRNTMQYADDSALVEVTVKTMNPNRQRSRSTAEKESWGQLLKEHKSGDKMSTFGNFDPLRTLHFLSKELQLQLQSMLPNDKKVQQMVSDMQYALKRVPPEVASQVHLLQGIEALQEKSKLSMEKKEEVETIDCGVQTLQTKTFQDNEKLQQIMAEGTIKLEASCRQMEKLCTDLKNEKNDLEDELAEARQDIKILKKKIDDLELENNEILNPRITCLEDEKRKLNNQLKSLSSKFDNQSEHTINDFKSQITELRCQKNAMEQECNKLKHQIKVGALEREKFVAVLTLRDTQINEIRTEMSQLQELVNEQLMELHTNAFQGVPNAENTDDGTCCSIGKSENVENQERRDLASENTLSTILTNDESSKTPKHDVSYNSFKELQSGDIDLGNLPELESMMKSFPSQDKKNHDQIPTLDKFDSQTSIKTMFDEIKKTAYAVAGSQRNNKYS